MNYKVPFYKPTYLKGLENINSESSFYLYTQDAVEKLEEKFKNISKSKHCLAVSNSSLAIHLSLCAIDLKRGDKVICAVNSYVDIPESIRHFDSEPIFTDIDKRSYNIDIESFKEAIKNNKSKKLRAVIVSHFAGFKQDIAEIIDIAKENNLIVIEDFSDTPTLENRADFSGDIAIYSLNYKLDNTIKGAMLNFKNSKEYERAKLLREHGLINKSKDVSYLYDIVDIGYDYRLDGLNAYLLSVLLKDRVSLIEKKREIAKIYFEELEGLKHITLPIKDDKHPYSYFIVEVDKNRDAFARELKKLGIEVGLHYIPLNFTKYYKEKYGLKIFSFPNALGAYQRIMSLPCNGKMSANDAKEVCKAVKEVAKAHI